MRLAVRNLELQDFVVADLPVKRSSCAVWLRATLTGPRRLRTVCPELVVAVCRREEDLENVQ